MAWILYEIVPSAYFCWAVCVSADRLKGNGVEMITGAAPVKIYLQISTGFYDYINFLSIFLVSTV